jgi:hypothetical protein
MHACRIHRPEPARSDDPTLRPAQVSQSAELLAGVMSVAAVASFPVEPRRHGRVPPNSISREKLSLPSGSLDLEVFDRELARGRAARSANDLPGAAQALHAALQLWRGPALDGLCSPLLDAERDRLAERRISVIEDRMDIDLAVDDDQDLVAELRRLISAHPLRERLRGLLMRALYRSGRQAEALAAFRDAHRYLLTELGVEPSAELRALHQRMLNRDPDLAPQAVTARPPAATPDPAHRPPIPAQLPHGMSDFTGREPNWNGSTRWWRESARW